jgi:hypothetical protein
MNRSQMMHIDPSDVIEISKPAYGGFGSLVFEEADSPTNFLIIFPPRDREDALAFLAALIERATELGDLIADEYPAPASVAV